MSKNSTDENSTPPQLQQKWDTTPPPGLQPKWDPTQPPRLQQKWDTAPPPGLQPTLDPTKHQPDSHQSPSDHPHHPTTQHHPSTTSASLMPFNPRIVAFPHEFSLSTVLRPDVPKAENVRVQKFQRLTPISYDRNVFHLELSVSDTDRIKDYKMGDALAVYPQNSPDSVDEFIRTVFSLQPNAEDSNVTLESIREKVVALPPSLVSSTLDSADDVDNNNDSAAATLDNNSSSPSNNNSNANEVQTTEVQTKPKPLFSAAAGFSSTSLLCLSTVSRVLTTILDINGNPSKEFFKHLSTYTTDILERVRLAELTLERLQDEFTEIVVEGAATHTSVLQAFTTARPDFSQLMDMIPPMKPRLYSIASSRLYSPNQLDLLVVEESWCPKIPKSGQRHLNPFNPLPPVTLRYGLCSKYLSTLQAGDTMTVSLTASTMFLPPSQLSPVIMAGLGTGMAPFRAFLQEKLYHKMKGVAIGPLALYFGSRHKSMEYLYGDELDQMVKEGLLTRLSCAFSRDQKEKIYIQHRIQEDAEFVAEQLLQNEGYFYLCGPTWPVEDIKSALIASFMNYGNVSTVEEAEAILIVMKHASRYVLEVY